MTWLPSKNDMSTFVEGWMGKPLYCCSIAFRFPWSLIGASFEGCFYFSCVVDVTLSYTVNALLSKYVTKFNRKPIRHDRKVMRKVSCRWWWILLRFLYAWPLLNVYYWRLHVIYRSNPTETDRKKMTKLENWTTIIERNSRFVSRSILFKKKASPRGLSLAIASLLRKQPEHTSSASTIFRILYCSDCSITHLVLQLWYRLSS